LDVDADRYREPTFRLAPEVIVKAHGVYLSAIFYLALARRGEAFHLQRKALLGGLVQASYLWRQRLEFSLRHALVDEDRVLLESARNRASELIRAEVDPQARKLLEAQYKNAGKIERELETTAGLTVYLWGRSLKWQNDFSWLRHDRIDENRDDFRFRSQMGLMF
jgi:hypothetical protein